MKGLCRDRAIGYPHMETSLSPERQVCLKDGCEGHVQGHGHRAVALALGRGRNDTHWGP